MRDDFLTCAVPLRWVWAGLTDIMINDAFSCWGTTLEGGGLIFVLIFSTSTITTDKPIQRIKTMGS